METVIKIENVSKRFRLYYDKPTSLKERVLRGGKGPYKEFYALKNVSFEIKKGSTVGLIGKNGCGKSTLLKMINRTMYPNQGKIQVKGKVSSLIELGAGFHPDLSGRENIYTNASIFGLTREEIEKRIPSIIEFSELEDFIDNPVRTYSSGMYARLAFSVAIHVDADILLVDEILGVGDLNFQSKCAAKIYEMRKSGMTIVLVTHDMSTIDRLCDYVVWFDHGEIRDKGEPKVVENRYLEFMANEQEERLKNETTTNVENQDNGVEQKLDLTIEEEENKTSEPKFKVQNLGNHFGTQQIYFTSIKLMNEKGVDKRSFYTGETVTLQAEYICEMDSKDVRANIGFEISHLQQGYLYGTNTAREDIKNIKLNKRGIITIELSNLKLLPGEYSVGIAIADEEEKISYDHYVDIAHFKMYSSIHDVGIVRLEHKFILDGKELGEMR